MRGKGGRLLETRLDVTEGDHRGETWERRCQKQWELVHKVANGLLIGCRAFIHLRWQELPGNAQFVGEEIDLILLGLEIRKFLVGQNEVEENKPGPHEF